MATDGVDQVAIALREAEDMERLRQEQEKVLKAEIRELERAKKREGANLDYLKNVMIKFLMADDRQVIELRIS